MSEENNRNQIAELSKYFHSRGWSLATSSNYSFRKSDASICITSSGHDKSQLESKDLMIVDLKGGTLDGESRKPSAETLLHCLVYGMFPGVNCVLHTHSVYATVLSMRITNLVQGIQIGGYEMLKALPGFNTHESVLDIPVFANEQDMASLSQKIEGALTHESHAFIIQGHGMYAWGEDIQKTKHQVEALEFLLECEYRARMMA